MKRSINDFSVLKILYSLWIAGVGLVVLKLITNPTSQTTSHFLIEFSSLFFFFALLFIADKSIRAHMRQHQLIEKDNNLEIKQLIAENKKLQEKLLVFEQIENEALRLATYKERLLKQIVENKSKLQNKHHLLHLLAELFQAGSIILFKETEQKEYFHVEESYAVPKEIQPKPFVIGEGLNGQAAADGVAAVVEDLPDHFLTISSGLGQATPAYLYILPVMQKDRCTHLFEVATFVKNDIEKLWNDLSDLLIQNGLLK